MSIEYRKNDLELTDYYYTNDGKPNFIFVRKDSIYTPRFADTDIPGYRYYFNKDYLLKWRWVDKPFDVKERALKSHRSEAKPQYLYQNSSKKEKKAFDKEEAKMLNAAYNTLAAMKKKSEHGRLHGYVIDREGKPVKGAKVEILENGKLVGELTTNEKGLYETGIMENKDGYDLKISADGFGEVEVKGVKVAETDEVILVEVIILVKASDKDSKVSLNLFDAEKAKKKNKKYKRTPLKKAKVVIRKGMENRSGDIVLETIGNEKGKADFNLPNGIYTVEILVDGYVTAYRSLVVEGDVKESLPLVKKPKKKGMKIVVNWEGDTDLDSTLFTPNEGIEGEVFYVGSGRKKEGKTKLILDGKKDYTTEVITIDDASKGNFKYYVSDYTKARKKDYTSKDMKKLKIIVYVYDENGLVAIYTLPYDVNGIIWEVFEVKNGKVLPLQKTYSNVKGKEWWTSDKTVTKNELAHREYEKLLREIMRDPNMENIFREKLDKYDYYNLTNSPVTTLKLSFAYHDFDEDKVDELIVEGEGVSYEGRFAGLGVLYKFNKKIIPIVKKSFGLDHFVDSLDYGFDSNYIYEIYYSNSSNIMHCHLLKNGMLVPIKNWEFHVPGREKTYYFVMEKEVDEETYRRETEKYSSNTYVKTIPLTDANLKKYRKTYNSTDFREYKNY